MTGVAFGVGVGLGSTTFTSVSVVPLDWQTRPSDKSAVPHIAVVPAAAAVTAIEYGGVVSNVGDAVTMPQT